MKTKTSKTLLLLLLAASSFFAQPKANFVTYGDKSNRAEGDNDFNQVFFFEIERGGSAQITIEIFDADCFGKNDVMFAGQKTTVTKFSLIGGNGAYSSYSLMTGTPRKDDIYKGTLIKKVLTSENLSYDNKWMKLATVTKTEGELVYGKYYLKLVVEGISGNDANVFNVKAYDENRHSVKIINFAPTVHLLPRRSSIHLLFNSRNDGKYTLNCFDGDKTRISVVTPYRNAGKLSSSGDGVWKPVSFKLNFFEQHELCAIEFGPGGSKYNDAVFTLTDEENNPIPFVLPLEDKPSPNRVKIVDKIIHNVDCNTKTIDVSHSEVTGEHKIYYKWEMPSGKIEYGEKNTLKLPGPGKYNIKIAANSSMPIAESGTIKNIEVVVNDIPTAIIDAPKVVAPNIPIKISGAKSIDRDGYIKIFNWEFSDGTFAEGKNIYKTFAEPGKVTVNLFVIDNYIGSCNKDSASQNIIINSQPKAIAGNDLICAIDEEMVFDGSNSYDSDGQIISYYWDFGDGRNARGEKVSHRYSSSGKYNVSLKVTDDAEVENSSNISFLTVTVNNPPIAKAGKDIVIAAGEPFNLDAGNSIDTDNRIVEYIWTIDGISKDSSKSLQKIIQKPGTYKAQLKVRDNSGTKSQYDTDNILITVNAQPVAIAGDDVHQTNPTILFDASSSYDEDGKIINYLWDFGDGNRSSSKIVRHTYASAGNYKVSLEVTDNSTAKNNKANSTKNVVINSIPAADAGPDIVVAPNEVFTLSGENSFDIDGTIEKYIWSFDNEIISNNPNFDYKFTTTGKKNILLQVIDNSGDAEAINFDNVLVTVNKAPQILTESLYKIPINTELKLDASNSFDSDGEIIWYKWRLDDKVISSSEKFNYNFAQGGLNKIILSVSDNSGVENSVVQKEVQVFVNRSPVAEQISSVQTCENQVEFSAGNSFDPDNDKISYSWSFGDGEFANGISVSHNYKKVGKYPVVLVLDDGQKLENSKTIIQFDVNINSAPIADAGENLIVCTGDIVTLDASKSTDPDGDLLRFSWDFGDSTSDEGITVTKNYSSPGLFNVVLTVTDNSGVECNSTVVNKLLTVVESPVAYAGEDIVGCTDIPVQFDASLSTDSDGIVNSFIWDFGDGTTGGGVKTTHAYKKAGVYTARVTITGELVGECDNTDTDDLIVTITDAPSAIIISKDSVAVNELVTFDGSNSNGKGNNITEYSWQIADLYEAQGNRIGYKFENAGEYLVELAIASDSKGDCKTAFAQKLIYVNQKPIAAAGDDKKGNIYQSFRFDASKSYDPNGQISEYLWDFGDGNSAKGIVVYHSYTHYGKFNAKLKVKDNTSISNNSAVDYLTVDVNAIPKGELRVPEYCYAGDTISIKLLNAFDEDGKIVKKIWTYDGNVDSSSESISYNFEKSGLYDISCKLIDDNGASVTLSDSIRVFALPTLSVESPTEICSGQKFNMIASGMISDERVLNKIEWHLPNNKKLFGNNISLALSELGENKIVVKYFDKKLNKLLSEKLIVVNVVSLPIAKFNVKGSTVIGTSNDVIIFDASATLKNGNSNLTYYWDFGDGTKSNGIVVTHKYIKAGNYRVKLSVKSISRLKCNSDTEQKYVKIKKRSN